MAITFIQSPATAHPAKNVADVIVNTDNQYAVAPNPSQRATLVIRFVAEPLTTSGDFTLSIGDPSLSDSINLNFTFHDFPDDSGQQLPTNFSGDFMDDYVNDSVIPALLTNYHIATNYDVSMINGSASQADIRFVAKNAGVENTIRFTENMPANEIVQQSQTNGSSPILRENFRIFFDLFAEQGFNSNIDRVIYSAEGVPDANGDVTFDIHRILTAATGYTVPGFTGNLIALATGPIRYFIKALESFGNPPVPRAYYREPSFGYKLAFHGSSPYNKYPYSSIHANYIAANQNAFLTSMPNGVVVHKNQKQFLSIFLRRTDVLNTAQRYRIKGVINYTDGTNSGAYAIWETFDNIPSNNFYTFRVGYNDLNINSRKASNKTVASYTIKITTISEVDVSQPFTFKVELEDTRHPRHFMFINSFGMPESIYCYGDRERMVKLISKTIQRHTVKVDNAKKIIDGEFDQVDTSHQNVYNISTGNKDRAYLQYFVDFINSPVRYAQQATEYQKVILDAKEFKIDDDNDTTFAMRFSYSDAQLERGIA